MVNKLCLITRMKSVGKDFLGKSTPSSNSSGMQLPVMNITLIPWELSKTYYPTEFILIIIYTLHVVYYIQYIRYVDKMISYRDRQDGVRHISENIDGKG